MSGSIWPGEDPNAKFYGLVTKKMRFKGRQGEMVNGYEVLWDDGERERWPYSYLLEALVPSRDRLIQDSDSEDEISSSDDEDVGDNDVFDYMTERDDPEDFEYREMFSTNTTGEDIVIPEEC